MKRILLLAFLFPMPLLAGGLRHINEGDTSSINYNFDKIKNEFSNTLHKSSTETVTGIKKFTIIKSSNALIFENFITDRPNVVWRYPGFDDQGFGYATGHNSVALYQQGLLNTIFRSGAVRTGQATSKDSVGFALQAQNNGMYSPDTTSLGFSVAGKVKMTMTQTLITVSSHTETTGRTPAVSSCGAAPSGSAVGTDHEGIITVGGGVVTACTITFNLAWSNNAICVATSDNAAIGVSVTATSSSAVTFGFGASLGGGKVYYRCGSYN